MSTSTIQTTLLPSAGSPAPFTLVLQALRRIFARTVTDQPDNGVWTAGARGL
jgi:hypothetical protein